MMNDENNDNILDLIRSSLHVHSVTLFMPIENSHNHTLVSSSVQCEPYIIEDTIITPGQSLVGWIARHQQPLILNQFNQQQRYLHFYSEQNEKQITSFMGCPIPNGGILCVDSITNHIFNEHDQTLLHRFAKLLAKHVHSMNVMYKNQKVNSYYDGLKQLIELFGKHSWLPYITSFLNTISKVTESDYTAFTSSIEGSSSYILEHENVPLVTSGPNNNASEFLFSNGGLIGWVFRNEVPVYAEGTDGSSTPLFGKLAHIPNFQSIMCLPIFITKNICGVLCLASHRARPLPQHMRIFTKMAATLLENHLKCMTLQHRLNSQLSHITSIHKDGALVYEPDVSSTQYHETPN